MTTSILVTGAAGFIGSHLARALAVQGCRVVGCDRLAADDPYLTLRKARVERLLAPVGVPCLTIDLSHAAVVDRLFRERCFDVVVHLAARAGVRDSVRFPLDYVGPNLVAFAHVLEACRREAVGHLLYASSSSVYGDPSGSSPAAPGEAGQPVSFYAATKRCNEIMAESYTRMHDLRITGLRFFTVYGPWGRPDMACYQFAQAIADNQPIKLYGHGDVRRDFTYVDDVVNAVVRLSTGVGAETRGHQVLDVGHHQPVTVARFVDLLERAVGRPAHRRLVPLPVGDVTATCADPRALIERIGAWEATPLERGLDHFARWFVAWQRRTSCETA